MDFNVNVYVGDRLIPPEEVKNVSINSETADRVINQLISKK